MGSRFRPAGTHPAKLLQPPPCARASPRHRPGRTVAGRPARPGRKNPAKSTVVQVPSHQVPDIEVWDDAVVVALADAHPDQLRAFPQLAASLGLREGELFGLAEEDLDLDGEKVVRIRRQVKKVGRVFVFALPKHDREPVIPLSDWDIQLIWRHVRLHPPRPYTLPRENPVGRSFPVCCA